MNPLVGRHCRCLAFEGEPTGIICDMQYVEVKRGVLVNEGQEDQYSNMESFSDWELLVLMPDGRLNMTLATQVVVS